MLLRSAKLSGGLAVITDLAVLAAALLVLWNWSEARKVRSLPSVPDGLQAKFSSGLWRGDRSRVLLIVSASCRYCSESTPFYRRLRNVQPELSLVAAFPHDQVAGDAWLSENGLSGLPSVGKVTTPWRLVTPTLALVDEEGRVTKSWVGRLNEQAEEEVLRRIGADQRQAVPRGK